MKWFNKVKNETWFQMAIALGIVVVLYFVLQHLRAIWNVVGVAWNIIVPLIVGLIIAYIVDPLVRLFERTIFKKLKSRKTARRISIVISIILVLAFVAALLWILIPQLIDSLQTLINNLSSYMANLETWLKGLGGGLFEEALEDINFSNIAVKLVEWLSGIVSGQSLITTSLSVGSGIISFIMSAILSVYYLFAKDHLISISKRFFLFVLKEKRYKPFIAFCSNSNKILVRYICCSILEAILVGACNAIVMLIFGMPYVAIISLVVGVTNLAPTFGPIAGGVIGGFILIMVDPVYALIFIITTIVLQAMDGYVLKPRLFAGTLGVSSLLILMSIIVFGRIFGVVGIIFAIPLAAIIQYLYKVAQDSRTAKMEQEAAAAAGISVAAGSVGTSGAGDVSGNEAGTGAGDIPGAGFDNTAENSAGDAAPKSENNSNA